jgi:adenylosuccinate lyase
MKTDDGVNDLLERIANDKLFAAVKDQLGELVDAKNFIGRAPQQVDEFIAEVVAPAMRERAAVQPFEGGVRV